MYYLIIVIFTRFFSELFYDSNIVGVAWISPLSTCGV